MKFKFLTGVALLSSLVIQGSSFAAEKEEIDVYVSNGGEIVLHEKDKITRFITPKKLIMNGSYQVVIKREVKIEDQVALKEPTESEKIEARRIMYNANQAFFKGGIEKAWELIEKAEALDPDYYRIKSMKGSLLYKIGSKDLAISLWKQSLAINPNQPEIVAILNKAQKEVNR